MKKITIFLSVALAALIILCGCINTKDQVTTIKVIETSETVLNKRYLDKCGSSAEEWIDAHGSDEYTGYSFREDGALILELTEEQRQALKDYAAEMVESARTDFEKEDPDFRVEVSEDYTSADYYYYPTIDKLTEAMSMSQMILYGCAWQIYNGCGEDDWTFEINIYNCRNGRLVTSGGTEEDIHYSEEDWK